MLLSNVTSLSFALIIPDVTDWPYPNALPIAITPSPTVTSSEFPSVAFLIVFKVDSLISDNLIATTATSAFVSVPFTLPSTDSPSTNWIDNESAPLLRGYL